MSAYTNHGRKHREEEQWVKINIDRKRSLYIGKDCLEKQKYCSTGDSRTELSF
jgi:hypothetical protein